jgi:thioredoxin 1
MSSHIKPVTDRSFTTEVIEASKTALVLVDFWADWCKACKVMDPVLEDMAKEFGDKLTVARMDVDHDQETPAHYAVNLIPTMILFKNGVQAAKRVGTQAIPQLRDRIETHI